MSFTSRIAAAAARGYGMFAAVARAVDPFFNYVTALLHGDGTNGAQNNTFLDSSTNNFTITRNGNTTQGTFSPFSQTGWSNYFDGSSSIYTPNTGQFAPTGDFTIEFWVYPITLGTQVYIGNYTTSISTDWDIETTSTGTVDVYTNGGTRRIQAPANTLVIGKWHYISLVRASNVITLYVNGVSQGTYAQSGTFGTATKSIYIGANSSGSARSNSYISNVRLVDGSAITTVPTTPPTAVSGTSLLTCQANRFLDASSNAFAITANGTPSVQAFSPFNPTSAWSASSNGGSGYFDGSGDYLTAADAAGLEIGNEDFTIECWVYLTVGSAFQYLISKGTNTDYLPYQIQIDNANKPAFYSSTNGTTFAASMTSSTAMALNSWNHIAVCRVGSAVTMYLNGSSVATGTVSGALYDNTRAVGIGGSSSGGQLITGYLSNVRIVKGTAVYTAAFTPPTAPLTAITNTSLLLNYTNAGIYDNAAVADYETLGNAQVSTSVVKYGTGSMAFDGTGDYLSGPTNANFAFGTGDFTVEGWVYFNSVAGTPTIYSSGTYNTSQFTLRVSSSKFQFYGGNGAVLLVSGSTTLTTGVWYHFAVCRIAGVTKLFVNGNTDVTDSTAFTYSPTGSFSVGETIGNTGQLNGYIDDLRITKGVGRYQYNFTPPTAAFPNIGGTVTLTADPYFRYTTLLLPGNGTNGAQNNTFLDSSSNAFTITRNGNTTQGNFSPFSQTGWSNYFDGNSDSLTFTATSAVSLTGAFTIEFWIYPTSTALDTINPSIITFPTQPNAYQVYINSANTYFALYNGVADVVKTANGSVALNQWSHIAISRDSSNNLSIFLNGSRSATTASGSGTVGTSTGTFRLMSYDGSTGDVQGYLSNLRIVKGTAVYDPTQTSFTVPTAPLTAITNTSLLTCQSNRFIDNSTNAFAITVNGDTSVQAFSPFAPTAAWSASTNGGSGYFDGSGDYLTAASNAAFDMGSGDFTEEFWVYPTTSSLTASIIDKRTSAGNYSQCPQIQINANQPIAYVTYTGSSWAITINGSSNVKPYSWNHVALTRSGNNYTLWLNGVSVGTGSAAGTVYSGSSALCIAAASTIGEVPLTGYLADVRIVKGTAVYTAAFTPPTAPLTAISGTSLLLSATNGAIVDATAKNNLETVGNAQISTTQSKFGGSSMYFDGTGDWLYGVTNDPRFGFGTGDFTIEFWAWKSANGSAGYDGVLTVMSGSTTNWLVELSSTRGFLFYNKTSAQFCQNTTTTGINDSTWHHWAICRSGSTWYLFKDGTALTKNTDAIGSSSISGGTIIYVGNERDGAFDYNFNGYIDDLRITKGVARYTSNFTPPTTAFPLQ